MFIEAELPFEKARGEKTEETCEKETQKTIETRSRF